MRKSHTWTSENRQFVQENVSGTQYKDLAAMINEEFNLELSTSQVKAYCNRNKFKNGLTGHFTKGHEPWNKEGEMTPSQKRSFKSVGDTRIDSRAGYLMVKVAQGGDPSKQWRNAHALVWEKEHGEVPKGHSVVFLDGDVTNLALSNLYLLSRAEQLRMNESKLFTKDRDLTLAGIALVRLKGEIFELTVKGKDKGKFDYYERLSIKNGISRPVFMARISRGWGLVRASTEKVGEWTR